MNLLAATILASSIALAVAQNGGYYGKYLGPLSQYHHGVSGEVYVVDARTLHIRDFTYDGEGPAAYFYVGNSKAPGPGGIRIRDETGSAGVLNRYNKKHITLTLPEGKSLSQMKWFSVWCDEFSVNFGHVNIPRGLEYPKPQKIGALSGVHGVASDSIVVVDAQTLLIPSFSYDGEAPDAKFWVGRGAKPTPQGIRVPDENGKLTPLRRYERKTIVLTLPGDLTIYDIDYFGVWCEAFTVDFGHVKIPQGLLVPPSLKMLGVSPQKRSLELSAVQEPNVNYFGIHQGLSEQVQPTTYRPFHRFSPATVNQQVQRFLQQQPILTQQQPILTQQQRQTINPQYQQNLNYQPIQLQDPRNQPYQQQLYQNQPHQMVLTLQPPPPFQQQFIYDSRLINQPQQYQIQQRPQQTPNQIFYQPNLQSLQDDQSVQILPSINLNPESQYHARPLDILNNQNIRPTYQPQQSQHLPQPIYYQPQPTTYQPTYYQPNNYIERRSFNQNPYINH